MLSSVLNLIGVIIMAMGVMCVYDARNLTRKYFSTSDTNSAVKTFKIVGWIFQIFKIRDRYFKKFKNGELIIIINICP